MKTPPRHPKTGRFVPPVKKDIKQPVKVPPMAKKK
jgi:hypothetical protein